MPLPTNFTSPGIDRHRGSGMAFSPIGVLVLAGQIMRSALTPPGLGLEDFVSAVSTRCPRCLP
jgi:hypothetical protein